MAKLEPLAGDYYLWQYLPSVPAAVIFLILFFVITALLTWRMIKTKTWFCIPFIVGGVCKYTSVLTISDITDVEMQRSLPVTALA
jgi:hypothetical protein